jgi:hypothetical protein
LRPARACGKCLRAGATPDPWVDGIEKEKNFMPVYDVMIKMVDYYHITVRAENEVDAKDEAMALWPGNENEKPELFVNYEGDDKHIIGDVYVDEVRLSPDQTVKVDNDEKPEDEPARALKNGVIGYAVRGTLTV